MLRKVYCLLSIIVIVLSFSVNKSVYANKKDRPLTLEECYIKMGYKSVEEAVREFENHYKKDVMLPSMEPSIPFTHRYGLFRKDKENKMNSRLDIQLLHEKLFGNSYTIEIRKKNWFSTNQVKNFINLRMDKRHFILNIDMHLIF